MQDSTTEIGAVPEPTVDASSVPASTVVEVMEVLQQQSQQLSQMHALLEQQALKIEALQASQQRASAAASRVACVIS